MTHNDVTTLDATDYQILRELSSDGRATDVVLGERANLSSTAIARRRRILEDSGVISGYNANLNLVSLGFPGVVLVTIEITSQTENVLAEFQREIAKCLSISYCAFVSGDNDFLAMIHVNSVADYDRIYRQELCTLPHVAKIRSSVVLREVICRPAPPIVFARSLIGDFAAQEPEPIEP